MGNLVIFKRGEFYVNIEILDKIPGSRLSSLRRADPSDNFDPSALSFRDWTAF